MHERTSPRLLLPLLVVLLGLVLWVQGLPAADDSPKGALPREQRLKAGLLIKITRYATWPADRELKQGESLVIGVFGDDDFLAALSLEAAKATSRPVRVLRLEKLSQALDCHVVLVCAAERRSEAEWFSSLKGRSVLTVGDSDSALRRGAAISLFTDDPSALFETRKGAAELTGIILDPRLLAVAAKPSTTAPRN